MEECLFYIKQYGSKVCMKDEQMDGDSDGPMCSSGRAVKKYSQRRQKIGQRCTGERDDDAQPAGGFWG